MMFNSKSKIIFFMVILSSLLFNNKFSHAQTNSSTVTNTTAPSASSTTTGGTSINYQTNSSFSNDIGFGPGFVCRTPSLVVNSSFAGADSENWASLGNSGTYGENYSASVGVVVPFGSPVLSHCERVAKQMALDKEISTQLSMIRACASLDKEGIKVDPTKFPLLSECIVKPGEPQIIMAKELNLQKENNLLKQKNPQKKIKIPRLID